MKFAQKLATGVRKHLSNLKRLYDRRIQLAEARAQRQLADAKTKTAREKVRLQLSREKMLARKELYEAQIATQNAKKALEKARKEAGDLTVGERMITIYRSLQGKPQKRKKKKPVSRKVFVKPRGA